MSAVPEPPDFDDRQTWTEWFRTHPNLIRALSLLMFFSWWEYAGCDMDPLFMTYPSAIFEAAVELTRSGELAKAFWESMVPFLAGLLIAIFGGILIGILIGQFWLLEYAFDPFINALYAIPSSLSDLNGNYEL